ncbi:hypothetical protein FQN55_000290 [Onygenales sp. PD_40]|nr:hypothetical protein FQN55_000290 [Onygenales sp. PD_40]
MDISNLLNEPRARHPRRREHERRANPAAPAGPPRRTRRTLASPYNEEEPMPTRVNDLVIPRANETTSARHSVNQRGLANLSIDDGRPTNTAPQGPSRKRPAAAAQEPCSLDPFLPSASQSDYTVDKATLFGQTDFPSAYPPLERDLPARLGYGNLDSFENFEYQRVIAHRPGRAGQRNSDQNFSGRRGSEPLSEDEEIPVSPMLREPETRAISEDQLTKEVRGIYAGILLVESKCAEVAKDQQRNPRPLVRKQWEALISLHRTLLNEHHDFFLASHHPSSTPDLRNLAKKYSMPARLWHHGIHSFLELLRTKLPESLEYMLLYVNASYSMVTLLMESVPDYEDTWMECLGDLARYRMAIEGTDMHEREVWSDVAAYWYQRTANRRPKAGRVQHHLGVLARPDILQQLFFYTKSLLCVQSFAITQDSIHHLFDPLLEPVLNASYIRHPPIMLAFVTSHAIVYRQRSIIKFIEYGNGFLGLLDSHILRVGTNFRDQGAFIASCNIAFMFEYGNADGIMMKLYRESLEFSPEYRLQAAKEYWANSPTDMEHCLQYNPSTGNEVFTSSLGVLSYGSYFTFYTLSTVLKYIGNNNVLPPIHVCLAFIWSLALAPQCMVYVQGEIPWARLAAFLNTLYRKGLDQSRVESESFPIHDRSTPHLPEDIFMRGQVWAQQCYPSSFFDDFSIDEEERSSEPPSATLIRTERLLWYGHRLASFNRWITFNRQDGRFYLTPLAVELEKRATHPRVFNLDSPFTLPSNIALFNTNSVNNATSMGPGTAPAAVPTRPARRGRRTRKRPEN